MEDIYNIVRDVLRDWWVVLCVALSAAFLVYIASATFTINIQEDQSGVSTSSTSSFYDNETAEQMAKTFPYILTSGVLRRKVAKDLGVAQVSGNIKASVADNTNLFTISVTDIDPERPV